MSVYEWQYWTNGPGSKPPLNDMKRAIEDLRARRNYRVFNQWVNINDPEIIELDSQIAAAENNYRAAGGQ